ncbi:MipA/OmpV family protein [Marinobacterium jannaschii]
MGGVTAEWYGDEVTNSPIVEDDNALSAFMGVSYRF